MQSNKKDKKQLSEDLVALFLLMLSYKNSKEFNKLLSMYKQNRDMLKDSIGKIYLKHIKNNEFHITQREVTKEVNLLKPKLIKIGNDMRKQENVIIAALLFKTYKDSYSKSIDIISKYKSVNSATVSKLEDKTIMKSLNNKIDGKTNVMRNKDNKTMFINKVKTNIKKSLVAGKSIEVINKIIDKDFQDSINVSNRMVDNEVSRVFNEAIILGYKEIGIERVIYNSTLDVNTCEECASRSGEIVDIDDATDLPRHVRCNCFYTPLI